MKKFKLIGYAIVLFILAGSVSCYGSVDTCCGVSIDVENIAPKLIDSMLVYSAKFICGTITANSDQPLVPGTYLTAINIHNPYEEFVLYMKKAVVTNIDSIGVGALVADSLGPNEGTEIDCSDVYDLLNLGSPPDFLKGFVVIKTDSPIELDVAAVYTLTR